MNESPDHWAHYKNICALAWRPRLQAAASAGPGQCVPWAEPPAAPHCGDNNVPTCPASGCQEGRTPGLPGCHRSVPYCPVLQAVPCVSRCLSLCLLEETSSQRTVPERRICLGSFLPFLHQPSRTCLSWDPHLQATVLHWQSSPRSQDRQKAPRGGPTSPWSPSVLLLGGQHLMRLISTTTMFSLPVSRLPAASAPEAASL